MDEDDDGYDEEEEISYDDEESDVIPLPYNSKIDIWSIGCILYELLLKETPFRGEDEIDIRRRIAGHIMHLSTTEILPAIYPFSKCPRVDILKEIDEFAFPQEKKKNVKFMDLCNSMELMKISPSFARKSYKKQPITASEKEECIELLNVIKRLLAGCLDPNQKTRFSAEGTKNLNCLTSYRLFNHFEFCLQTETLFYCNWNPNQDC
jgi:serine/threonine protein kinase